MMKLEIAFDGKQYLYNMISMSYLSNEYQGFRRTQIINLLIPYTFVFVRLNFSDAEIEIFIASYDADGNELLDVKEMQAVEQRRAPTANNER